VDNKNPTDFSFLAAYRMKTAPDSACNEDITWTATTARGIAREILVPTALRLTSPFLAPRSVSQMEISLGIAACSRTRRVRGCVTQSIDFHKPTRDSYTTRLEKPADSLWLSWIIPQTLHVAKTHPTVGCTQRGRSWRGTPGTTNTLSPHLQQSNTRRVKSRAKTQSILDIFKIRKHF